MDDRENNAQDAGHHRPSGATVAFESLPDVLKDCFARLARGVADRRSPFHTPFVSTLGLDGRPRQRVVVLRGLDVPALTLRFHTDRRSDKVAEITRDPRIAVSGYDPGAKVQIRLEGVATLHHDDATGEAAWNASRLFSKACYAVSPAPGIPLTNPGDFQLPDTDEQILAGRENFCAVLVAIQSLEWLYLQHGGHRRASFRWDGAGAPPHMTWLVP